MEVTDLLEGSGVISSQELVFNFLKTALLSLERDRIIQFEIITKNDSQRNLLIKPTGKNGNYPLKTLEARLLIHEPTFVSVVVEKWLVVGCPNPYILAVERGKVMLTLRGLAKFDVANNSYTISESGQQLKIANQNRIADVKQLLNDFAIKNPEMMVLLDSEIEIAIKNKTLKSSNEKREKSPNAWLNESEEDRYKFVDNLANYNTIKYTFIISLIIGVIVLLLWAYSIINVDYFTENKDIDPIITAIVITTLLGIFFLLNELKVKPIVNLANYIRNNFTSKSVQRYQPTQNALERACGAIAGIGIFGLLIHVILVAALSHPMLIVVFLGVGGYFLNKKMKINAREAINKKVITNPDTSLSTEHSVSNLELNLAVSDKNTKDSVRTKEWEKPIQIDVVSATNIPDVSQEGIDRIVAIKNRGPEYFKLARKILTSLSSGVFFIALFYWVSYSLFPYLTKKTTVFDYGNMVAFSLFYFFTIGLTFKNFSDWVLGQLLINFAKLLSKSFFGLEISADVFGQTLKTDESKALRPTGLIIFIWIWFCIAISDSATYASLTIGLPVKLFFTISSLLILILFFVRFETGKRTLEKKYPFKPPINLLTLRVFGSPYLTDFLRLTNSWQWLGTRQRLDGPETAGYREIDVINYLTGRIDRSIIENDNELKEALKSFDYLPNSKLCFPVNSIQCTNDTWKDALQYLLDEADSIVMDFSYLSEKNKGVAFELQKLFEQFSTDRLLLLINDSTDMNVLEEIANKAWNSISENSPNYKSTDTKISFIHTGVIPPINEHESIYDWQKRFKVQIDGDKLVCLMFDKSQPLRKEVKTQEPDLYKNFTQWTNLPIPKILKIIIKVIIGLYFFTKFYTIISELL